MTAEGSGAAVDVLAIKRAARLMHDDRQQEVVAIHPADWERHHDAVSALLTRTAELEASARNTEFGKEAEKLADDYIRLNSAYAELEAERDALRADAERYRWLRDHADSGVVDAPYVAVRSSKYPDRNGNPSHLSWSGPTAEGLDAAIDKARAEAGSHA